ncbi:MAG: MBL fold metallo-hydrolase [Arcanobacterium sp.]|nr:MBL fold metallo-hydrolase [Arcanobacterium sp.]
MRVIILRFDQTLINANTYVLVPDGGKQALVVDPGAGSRFWIQEALERLDVELGAVLLTHGHADHIWDVSAISGSVPVYIAEPDLYRLDDPLGYLGMANLAIAFPRMGVSQWQKPENLQTLPVQAFNTSFEIVPRLPIRAVAAPGHTEGSTVFLFDGQSTSEEPESIAVSDRLEHFMLSGDVIFNNGIGRTDLPGGDEQKMAATLRFLVNSIRPETILLPGHGSQTNMFHETRHSEFLHAAMS